MMHAKSEKTKRDIRSYHLGREREREYSWQKVFYPKLDGTCHGMSNGGERALPTIRR